jgi:hypothetical protein
MSSRIPIDKIMTALDLLGLRFSTGSIQDMQARLHREARRDARQAKREQRREIHRLTKRQAQRQHDIGDYDRRPSGDSK